MSDAIPVLIGRHVAARRTRLALTQEELAKKTGISRQALSMIERGVNPPRWGTVYDLAEALRVEVFDLVPTVKQVRLVEAASRIGL